MAALNFLTTGAGTTDNTSAFEQIANKILGKSGRTTSRSDANTGNRIFEEFSRQTQQREDLLLSATKEQVRIFKQLERTLADIKKTSTMDLTNLTKTIKILSDRLSRTTDTPAKSNIKNLIDNIKPGVFTKTTSTAALEAKNAPRRAERSAIQPAATGAMYSGAGLLGSENITDDMMVMNKKNDDNNDNTFLDNLFNGILGLTLGKGVYDLGRKIFGGNKTKVGPKTKVELDKNNKPLKGTALDKRLAKNAAAKKAARWAAIKSISKKIPGISLLAGGLFAAGRLAEGDMTGAGLEAASGIAGTFPGAGTVASMGIDATLMARDMKKGNELNDLEVQNQLVNPAGTPTGTELNQKQNVNNNLQTQMQTNPPPIIVNQSTPIVKTPAPSFIAPSQSIRPTESTLLRYQNRESFY